jgi:endonuclease YncB( thermonuclease family)
MRLLLTALIALLALPAGAAAQAPGTPAQCEIGARTELCEFWSGKVTFIGDGDTMSVDLTGDGTKKPVRVRITGIDTMEQWYYTNNPNDRTGECHANDATERLEQLVKRSRKRVRLWAQNPDSTSRGRLKRAVQVKINGTWRDVGTQMLKGGHALWVSSRGEWAWNESYSVTAQRAALRRLGIWNPDQCSPGPFDSASIKVWANPDPEGKGVKEAGREWIRIKNLHPADTLPLGGWWVRDSGLRRYVFADWTLLPPGATMTVHIGTGPNDFYDTFWGLAKPVLDNVSSARKTGDGAYLYDYQGDLRASSTWPCRYECNDPYAGAIEIDPAYERRDEFVRLRNVSAAPVDLEGYRLSSRPYYYAFGPDSVIQPGETMRVNVRGDAAADTRLEKHWGKTKGILANGGDRVILESLRYVRIGCTAWGTRSC